MRGGGVIESELSPYQEYVNWEIKWGSFQMKLNVFLKGVVSSEEICKWHVKHGVWSKCHFQINGDLDMRWTE